MEIETALPEDFDSLEEEEKVRRLENLVEEFDEDTEKGSIKKRMAEELLRSYR